MAIVGKGPEKLFHVGYDRSEGLHNIISLEAGIEGEDHGGERPGAELAHVGHANRAVETKTEGFTDSQKLGMLYMCDLGKAAQAFFRVAAEGREDEFLGVRE
jgi:hypothetical protein